MTILHPDISQEKSINGAKGAQKTIGQINAILADPADHFEQDIDKLLRRTLAVSAKKITQNAADQKEVFDSICHFLNTAFANINIKKFYNTAPNISFHEYNQLPLGEKFAHNVYGKEWKLFYKDAVSGANCHHWTLLLKEIFDELQAHGLQIKSRILFSNIAGGHSFLGIQFQGKIYIADVFGFNDSLGKVISQVKEFPKEIAKQFSKFSFNKKQDEQSKAIYLDTSDEFVHNLEIVKPKNIALKFRPNLKGVSSDIGVDINHTGIFLSIDQKMSKFNFPKNFELPKNLPTTHKMLEYMLQHVTGDKEQKKELQTYLVMICPKINPKKLYEIFEKKD